MEEYGTFGCTALKLDIGTESLYLGPGLAYLYGTFGCTVGKLVGQYSDSNRVSHSRQSQLSGDSSGGSSPSSEESERESCLPVRGEESRLRGL